MNRINKYKLSNQLDQLADNVIKRGVYVIDKTGQSTNIVDYLKKQTVLTDIPTVEMANNICDQLNKLRIKQKPNLFQAQHLIDYCNRLNSDTICYRHTINTTRDDFKRDLVAVRLDSTLQTLKQVIYQINKIFQ